MVRLQSRSGPTELFGSFSDEEKRKMSEWNLKTLELEMDRRQDHQELTDEELLKRLAGIVPSEQLHANGIEFYQRMRQVTDEELARLIEIRKLYLTSSPYSSSRIELYEDISALAPWDETCLLRIVSEYEESDQPLKACDWLAKAASVNPDNESTRTKLESLTAATAALRRRVAILRYIKYAAAVGAVLFLVWCAGYRISWDEAIVLDALAGLEETKIPADVKPDNVIRHVFTGYQRVKFSNPLGASYVILVSSPFRQLQHLPVPAKETTTEQPSEDNKWRFTVRGSEAEFIYQKYNYFESVLGYFQGKRHPVAIRARFEFADRDPYAGAGGAQAWIKAFDPAAVD